MNFKCTSIDYTGTTIHSTFCNKCALLRTSISVFICGFPRHNLAFVIRLENAKNSYLFYLQPKNEDETRWMTTIFFFSWLVTGIEFLQFSGLILILSILMHCRET